MLEMILKRVLNDDKILEYVTNETALNKEELLSRQLDNVYRMDHAVAKAQREILSAFGIEGAQMKYKAAFISEALREGTK